MCPCSIASTWEPRMVSGMTSPVDLLGLSFVRRDLWEQEKGFSMKTNKPTLNKIFHNSNLTCAVKNYVRWLHLCSSTIESDKEMYTVLPSLTPWELLCANFDQYLRGIKLNVTKHLCCINVQKNMSQINFMKVEQLNIWNILTKNDLKWNRLQFRLGSSSFNFLLFRVTSTTLFIKTEIWMSVVSKC